MTALQAGAVPRTRVDWQHDLKYGRRDRVDHEVVTASAFTLSHTVSGRSWDGLVVKDIVLPEALKYYDSILSLLRSLRRSLGYR